MSSACSTMDNFDFVQLTPLDFAYRSRDILFCDFEKEELMLQTNLGRETRVLELREKR